MAPSVMLTKAAALPHSSQPKFLSQFGRCAPGSDCVLLTWVHYQKIMSNLIFTYKFFFFFTVF